MKKFLDDAKNFVKLHREYFISVALVFLMFNLALIINANWPYGDTTPLVSDSYAQILPFAEHIFSVFRGEATLFYTNHLGGGFEIFSTIEYMLFNPFYLIVLVGGSRYAARMFTISWLLMLCFNVIVFIWFAKKYFKNLKPFVVIIFSLLYTFSGYVVQTYSFITWQIYPALILLVIDGFMRLVNEGKISRFIIFLSWYVINCFSVGVSTTIMLFLVFSAYIFFMFSKEDRKPIYARFFVALLVSVLVCVVVLFPSITAFMGSGRSTSVLENLLVYKNKSFLNKISVIFADSMALILMVAYFIKNRAKRNIDKFFLVALALVMLPTIFDSCQKLLCGSNYQGFVSRFYFLAEALIFILALKFLNEEQFEFKLEKSNQLITAIFFATLSVVIVIGIAFFALSYKHFGGLNKSQGDKDYGVFFENLVIFIIIGVFALVAFFGAWKKLFTKRVVSIAFSILLVASLCSNYVSFFGAGKSDNKVRDDIAVLSTEQKLSGSTKFIGDDISMHSVNEITVAQNISVFSSLTSTDTLNFNSLLGRVTTDVYVDSTSGNIITDALSGIKYYYSMEPLDRPYLTFVKKQGSVYLYRNELALSGALALKNRLEDGEIHNYKQLISSIANKVNFETSLIQEVNNMFIKNLDDGKRSYTFTAEADGILYVSAELGKDEEEDYYKVQMTAENTCLELAYLKAGETYTLVLSPARFVDLNELEFVFVDYENAKNFVAALEPYCAEFEYTKNGYSIKSNFDDERFIYVFSPNISGLNYFLNGEKLNDYGAFCGMMFFSAKAGENTFSAKYEYKYWKLWLIISILAILSIVAVLILYHFTGFKHISGVITCAIYVVNCCFLVLFYFLGVILSFIGFSL